MRKTIITSITAIFTLVLANSAFAQINTYNSPFGGSYRGDFQNYTPDNQSSEKTTQKYKVVVEKIVLLTTDATLKRNTTADKLADYVKRINKVATIDLNNLNQSNGVVLQFSIKPEGYIISLALKNKLSEADKKVMDKFYKDLTQIRPINTYENILFHIYLNVDTRLPKEK